MDLYNSDCFDVIGKIPAESIDCIITDPPYGISISDWDKLFDIEKISLEWYRVLKQTGSLFVFCGWSFEPIVRTKMHKDFRIKDAIIYDRIKGRGGRKSLTSTREDILWYVKGNEWVFNKELAYSTIIKKTKGMGLKNKQLCRSLSNVWTDISPIVPWSKERCKHPTQKPVKLIERIISVFTKEGMTVLDTYMGSGTTGVACAKLKRNFIGIEKEKAYYDIAITRIEKAQTESMRI